MKKIDTKLIAEQFKTLDFIIEHNSDLPLINVCRILGGHSLNLKEQLFKLNYRNMVVTIAYDLKERKSVLLNTFEVYDDYKEFCGIYVFEEGVVKQNEIQ